MKSKLLKIGVLFLIMVVAITVYSATVFASVINVESITINKTYPTSNDVILNTHESVNFAATVSPSTATDKAVHWVSTNESVLKLKTGAANPSASVGFDVKGPGTTTIIATSNVGTPAIAYYTVNVVDNSITDGRYVAKIEAFETLNSSNALEGQFYHDDTLDDYYRTGIDDDSFSIYLKANYSGTTAEQLTYNEIQQLFTFYSDNSANIYFEGFEPVTGKPNVARAIFSVENVSVQSAKATLRAYVYDGVANTAEFEFSRTVVSPLSLTQKATVTADGLSASYYFTHAPSIVQTTSSPYTFIRQASEFLPGDFEVQWSLNGSPFVYDTNRTVTDVDWNSSSKTLTFKIDTDFLGPNYDFRIVPKWSGSNPRQYAHTIDGSYELISYDSTKDWQQFTGPGSITTGAVTITPSTTSANYSTDGDRIMFATTGKAGSFTVNVGVPNVSAAQFTIESFGTLPSGVTFKSTGDGKTATIAVPSTLAAGTYYIDVRVQSIDDASVMEDKRLELRVGTLGTFSVSNVTLTKANSSVPVIQTSSPVKAVNGDTLAATYKYPGATNAGRIERTIFSLDGTQTIVDETITLTDTIRNHLASATGHVLSYEIGDTKKLDLGTYIMRVELFDIGGASLGITEVRFAIENSFEMYDIATNGTGNGIKSMAPDGTELGTFKYNKSTGLYKTASSGNVNRRTAKDYQDTITTATGDTLQFLVAVEGYNVGDRIKFIIDDFVFGANKGGGITSQIVTVEAVGGYHIVRIPFNVSETTYLGTHVVQIKMAKSLDSTETFDHTLNVKYILESDYRSGEVEVYDELTDPAGERIVRVNGDLNVSRTLFVPEDKILIIECGNQLLIDSLKHVTVYGEIRMNEKALAADGNLVVTGKVALCSEPNDETHPTDHSYYYYASTDKTDNPHLLITEGSNITMNGSEVDGYVNMLTGSAVMETVIPYQTTGGSATNKFLRTLASGDSFVVGQDGSQVTLAAGETLTLDPGAKLTVGKDSRFINEGSLSANRADLTSPGDLITRRTATGVSEIIFTDVGTTPFISSSVATGQFFLGGSALEKDSAGSTGRNWPFDLDAGAVAITGMDYTTFDYKIFGNVETNQDLVIRASQQVDIEQDSLLWIKGDGSSPVTGHTLTLDGELHNKGALWIDGRALGDGKYIEYVDSVLDGDGYIELNGAQNVLGAITGDVKLQKKGDGYIITIPEGGSANVVANFKMSSNDELIVESGATLTVNSGVVFEVDGKVAIESSKSSSGISLDEGKFINSGTTTFGFENTDVGQPLPYFSNLGTMTGTFGVKTSTALNALVIQDPVTASWHTDNVGNNGISPNCGIQLVGVNADFSTPGNWDLSYRVSSNVYNSKNITFTGGGIDNTTIMLTNTDAFIDTTLPATPTDADISKHNAMISDLTFTGINLSAGAGVVSNAFFVDDKVSSDELTFENCEFTNFTGAAFSFNKTTSGTDNVSNLEITNCVFDGPGIWANKLTNSSISDSTFNYIDTSEHGIRLDYQGLKNSSGSDLYNSGVEIENCKFTSTNTDEGTGVYIGGAEGAYIGETTISGSTFTGLEFGVNVVTPIVSTSKSNDQITLKDLLITSSTFDSCQTAINAKNDDAKHNGTSPYALTLNNLLGTITYSRCDNKLVDPDNVFTFLVTNESTLNTALSMSMTNITMANSFSISSSVNLNGKHLIIPKGMTLTVNSTATLRTSNNGSVDVQGTLDNKGILNIADTSAPSSSITGTGRVNTLVNGKVDGSGSITMLTETVDGSLVKGNVDGVFFGDVTVNKNSSAGTYIIGVTSDGYVTQNANFTLKTGNKIIGGDGTSQIEVLSNVTLTVAGEVEETYNQNSLIGAGTISFTTGSKLFRLPDPTGGTARKAVSQVLGEGGYLTFDKNVTNTKLNRTGDASSGFIYKLVSGKMTIDAEAPTTPVPFLVDGKNTLEVSSGANITVPSGHKFIVYGDVSGDGLVLANQSNYGTIIGVDSSSLAEVTGNSSFGSLGSGNYLWAVDKWASAESEAGQDNPARGIGLSFQNGAETVYFDPVIPDPDDPTNRTTTGNLTVPAGRSLVIAANKQLIILGGTTFYVNGDLKLETGATLVGSANTARMVIATGKTVSLGGVNYTAGEYIWDGAKWVLNVYDQASLTAALANATVKSSRATKSFNITSSVTVRAGYGINVDPSITLTVNEGVTVTVATNGAITGLGAAGHNALEGVSHNSKLVVQANAAVKLNTDADSLLAHGINYAWNVIPATKTWTAYAGTAAELIKLQNAGNDTIVTASFSVSNGTTIISNLYIPDGITLTVPSGYTLNINENNPDLVNLSGSSTQGRIIGASTTSKLVVLEKTADTDYGYGEPVGSYSWVNSDWMKVITSWNDLTGATGSVYFSPTDATTRVTVDTPISADVTIANSKTILINPGIRLTVNGNITLGTSASIKGSDSSSELYIKDGTYPGLAKGEDYAWYSSAWRKLVEVTELGTTVPTGQVIVLGRTAPDTAPVYAISLANNVLVDGTLVIQKNVTLTIDDGVTLQVTGTLADGLILGTDPSSRLRISKEYVDQTGTERAAGWYIWSGAYDSSGNPISVTWRKTSSSIPTYRNDSDGAAIYEIGGSLFFERSSTATLSSFYIGRDIYNADGTITDRTGYFHINPSAGTEIIISGTLRFLNGSDLGNILVYDGTAAATNYWKSLVSTDLTDPDPIIKGLNTSSKIIVGSTTYTWDPTTQRWG